MQSKLPTGIPSVFPIRGPLFDTKASFISFEARPRVKDDENTKAKNEVLATPNSKEILDEILALSTLVSRHESINLFTSHPKSLARSPMRQGRIGTATLFGVLVGNG